VPNAVVLLIVVVLIIAAVTIATGAWRLAHTGGSQNPRVKARELRQRTLPSRAASPDVLAERTRRRMEAHVVDWCDGKQYAPSYYTIALAVPDFDEVSLDRDGFVSQLVSEFTKGCRANGWSLARSPKIELVFDDDVTEGSPRVHARFAAGDVPEAAMAGQAILQIVDSGDWWPLAAPEMIIGRGSRCDVQIDRSSVSRRHCELKLHKGTWTVCDLESSNGTFFEGERLEPGARVATTGGVLRLGSRVELRVLVDEGGACS